MRKREGKKLSGSRRKHRGIKGLRGAFFAVMAAAVLLSDSVLVSAAGYSEEEASYAETATETEGSDNAIVTENGEELELSLPTGDLFVADEDADRESGKEISAEEYYKLVGDAPRARLKNALNTNDYYYKQLNSNDKLFYKAYLDACRANKGAVEELTESNASTYGVMFYTGTTKLEKPDWNALSAAMEFDHPEELESILYLAHYAWFTTYVNGSPKYIYYFYFEPGAEYTGSQVAKMEADLQTACNAFYNGLILSWDAFTKELAIHDALLDAMDYNHPVADNHLSNHVAHTAYGAFVDHMPVCDGYSKAFKMLLNKAGIECHIVAGLGNGGGHAWNIVKIGSDYYEVDVTWDDQNVRDDYNYGFLLLHDYFNRTTADFKNHKIEIPGYSGSTSHIRHEDYLGYTQPAIANGTSMSYRNVNKIYKVTFDEVDENAYYYLPYGYTYTFGGKIVEMPTSMWFSGYDFDNWYTQKDGGTVITQDTVLTQPTTAYAHWKGTDVTVTLYLGGGLANRKVTVQFNGTYGDLPTDVTRKGYIFDGWYRDSSYTKKVTADTKVDTYYNHTLYAKWIQGDYRVSFDANGGTVSKDHIDVKGGRLVQNFPTPERYGYTFLGWYDAKDGGNKVPYISEIGENQTLYAHWTPKKSTVYFHYYDGVNEDKDAEVYYGGTYEDAISSLGTPSREGYKFVGWFTDTTDGEEVTKDTVVTKTNGHHLYAHWTNVSLDVTFVCHEGSCSTSKKSVEVGKTYGKLPVPKREGYIFAGWFTETEGEGVQVTENTKVENAGYQYLYAYWKYNMLDVTFVYHDGTGQKTTKSVEVGSTYGELPVPTRQGYAFSGWYTDTSGKGTKITESTVIESAGHQYLYAYWTDNTLDITFKYTGGTGSMTYKTVENGKPYGSLPVATREGYTFLGWFDGDDVQITENTIVGITGDQNLYAKWSINGYTVTYDANGGHFDQNNATRQVSYEYDSWAYFYKEQEPVREGYKFDGWSLYQDTRYVATSRKVTGDMTVYAIWEKNSDEQEPDPEPAQTEEFTLRIHPENGENVSERKIARGTKIGDLPSVSRYGYTFVEWSDSSSGGKSITSSTVIIGDMDIYAVWNPMRVCVYFHADNSNVAFQWVYVDFGSTYGEAMDQIITPQYDNGELAGWFTGYYTDVMIDRDSVINTTDIINLYAQKVKVEYTFTYHANGGTFNGVKDVKARSVIGGDRVNVDEMDTPSREGYRFIAWSSSSTKPEYKTFLYADGNMDFYAFWEKTSSEQEEEGESGQGESGEGNGNEPAEDPNGTSQEPQSGDDKTDTAPQSTEDPAAKENGDDNSGAPAFPEDGKIEKGSDTYRVSPSGTGSVVATNDTNVKSVTVYDEVYYGDTGYKVTEIEKNAYKNCKKLKSVNIGANIEKIGSNAFKGCKNLKKITIRANNLKSVGGGSFKGIKDGAKITIICKDKKTYNKIVKKLKKAGAKKAKFKFKKG